jgi:myo-inositol-1-phosphate synthase
MSDRTGVWIVGARGDVAVTTMLGCRAIARGLAAPVGLVTALDEMKNLDLIPLDRLTFGGVDPRTEGTAERAWQIHREHRVFDRRLVECLVPDLDAVDAAVSTVGAPAGTVIRREDRDEPLRRAVDRVRAGIAGFRERSGTDRVVVVNLASTEPPVGDHPAHHALPAFEAALDADVREAVSPSVLYAYAALSERCAYVNFTPSRGARVAALDELALRHGVPYCGNDGKTGETLVKTALAPMFRGRNLKVLSWLGFNMLGNSDGRVLADPVARESKLQSKGGVLPAILGYAPDGKVAIDYVPSLGDWKVAWDFIHFEGFLGTKMSLQFTWQGCDSMLAAPLVLDLVRLADRALRRGERGFLAHTACFFKDPIGVAEHALAAQFQMLLDYAACG